MRTSLFNALELTPPRHYRLYPGEAGRVYGALRAGLTGGDFPWCELTEEDWALFGRMAHPDKEGIGPLLFDEFRRDSWPEPMPVAVREALRGYYYNTLANNTIRLSELNGILASFHKTRIPVIVIKGAALAPTVYGDIGLRPMADLDVLVRPEKVRAAMRALENQGYRLLKAGGKALFTNRSSVPVMVELHWGFIIRGAQGSVPDMDWFWDRSLLSANGQLEHGSILNPEAHILFLIAHQFMQHQEFDKRLLWLQDVDLLLRRDPEALNRLATDPVVAKFGWSEGFAKLRKAVNLEAADRLDPGLVGTGAADEDAGNENLPNRFNRGAARILYGLSLLSWPTRLRMAWRIAFPPYDYMVERYAIRSRAQLPFTYAWRIVHLIRILSTG